ncbi:FIST signal transduction protein [Candidatus Borrarchaeum sp.]|uniref:FIST signal transduction protein n=1 Tax=Candidatus Borrarchaeum sp. TaxID=2846742 RepID=UPI00257D9FF4|nr:FIST N-terminal domain-containing protein [Candidatus Borrarchaeum sp.]
MYKKGTGFPKESYEGVIVGKNVKTGFAYRRTTEGVSDFDLAKITASEALKKFGGESFSLALVYSAYEYNPKEVAAGINAGFLASATINRKVPRIQEFSLGEMKKYPTAIDRNFPWIGCTTSGEITSAGLFEDSIVVAIISSPYIKFGVGVGKNVSETDTDAGKAALNMALGSLTAKGGALKEGTNYILMHGSVGGEEGVMRGIQEEFGNIPVVGGTAGNALTENPSYVFVNGKAYTDAVVLGLISSEVFMVIDSGHGWKPTGKVGLVTKAAPPENRKQTLWHKVYTINNQPAAEWYAEQISELKGSEIFVEAIKQYYPFVTFGGASGLGGTGYPIGIKDPQGRIWTRDIHSVEEDGSLTFWSYIPEGIGLQVLEGTPDTLTDKSEADAKDLFDKYEKFKPVIMFDYNSVGRKIYLSKVNKLREEYRNIQKFTKRMPIVGFYTHGEQVRSGGLNQHCNLTITRLLITDTLVTT